MADIVPNPYQTIYNAIWNGIWDSPKLAALVLPGNRVSLASETKPKVLNPKQFADFPSVSMFPVETTTNHVQQQRVLGEFSLQLTGLTCSTSTVQILELAWQMQRSLEKLHTNLDLSFVSGVDFGQSYFLPMDPGESGGLAGWSVGIPITVTTNYLRSEIEID